MPSNIYRYTFTPGVDMGDVERLLLHAVASLEYLHGEAAARLDARFFFDERNRRCVLDGASHIGMELNKLFAGSVGREISPDAYTVDRVAISAETPIPSVDPIAI